jgi:hypothetical protein
MGALPGGNDGREQSPGPLPSTAAEVEKSDHLPIVTGGLGAERQGNRGREPPQDWEV